MSTSGRAGRLLTADDSARWHESGYLHFAAFLAREEVERYGSICRRIVAQWEREHQDEPWLGKTTNMAQLTEPRYFRDKPEELTELLELIADERILAILRRLAGTTPLFHNTQFFFEQHDGSWEGDWHRDTQFDADDDDDEKRRMRAHTGVHFRMAFVRDPWLEIVPGSHRRWDHPKELERRKARDPKLRSHPDMPGRQRLVLEAGDALLFHAWSIHRGSYRATPERRTLDIIYGWPVPSSWAVPPPTCFADDAILETLSPRCRGFFERFLRAYRSRW